MKVFSSGEILALLHPGLDFIRELAAPVEVGSSPSISHRSWLFSSRTLIERSNFSVRNQATGRPSLMAVEQLARGAQNGYIYFRKGLSLSSFPFLLSSPDANALSVLESLQSSAIPRGPNPPRIIDSSLLIQGRSDAKNCFLSYPFTRKKGLKQCVHGHSEHRIFGIKERVGQVREGRAG
ncbi:hypothetical protein TSUD_335790 [Trifolium subterraneum]|uniref:Uncharacterized protein n=1 Tax=Trifolium subterraneum TaxID=3900 RepID=A0A2Z6MAY1_TRISU|nr:hypothetical protein TSUD_335790 [Trifolium subterraneum]